ncbi:hypothetical protein Hypma_001288 [Hypsizygus marmoreus]|uniref:Uncharacterized protein n=1 Tax=Hypsizygus marmoreus TaxID=39966 RepID=A0A369K8F3_HYPMA|nr:hypothetical protein Hypma_001288 [Hypsizygus marmoreus]
MIHNVHHTMQSSNTKEVHSSAVAQHSATDPTVPTSFDMKCSLPFPSCSFTFTHALSNAPQIDPVAVFRGMDEILQQVLTNDTSAQDPRIWDRFLCLSYLGILVKSVPDDFALSLSTEERAAHLQDLEVRLEKLKESNVPRNDGLPPGQVTPGPSPPAVHHSGDPTRPDSPASGSLIDFEQSVFSTDTPAVVDGEEPAIAQMVPVPDQQYQESFAPPNVATPNLHPRVPFQARNASHLGASTAFGTYGSGTVSPAPPLAIPDYSVGRVMQPMPRMSNFVQDSLPCFSTLSSDADAQGSYAPFAWVAWSSVLRTGARDGSATHVNVP